MNQWHLKNTKKWFERYKKIVSVKVMDGKHVKAIFKKIDNMNLRDSFKRWARFMNHEKFCQDMNEVGPITEFVFEAKRTHHNLKEFMKMEHFTPEEIQKESDNAHNTNMRLIKMLVNRLKIPRQDRTILRVMN